MTHTYADRDTPSHPTIALSVCCATLVRVCRRISLTWARRTRLSRDGRRRDAAGRAANRETVFRSRSFARSRRAAIATRAQRSTIARVAITLYGVFNRARSEGALVSALTARRVCARVSHTICMRRAIFAREFRRVMLPLEHVPVKSVLWLWFCWMCVCVCTVWGVIYSINYGIICWCSYVTYTNGTVNYFNV